MQSKFCTLSTLSQNRAPAFEIEGTENITKRMCDSSGKRDHSLVWVVASETQSQESSSVAMQRCGTNTFFCSVHGKYSVVLSQQ